MPQPTQPAFEKMSEAEAKKYVEEMRTAITSAVDAGRQAYGRNLMEARARAAYAQSELAEYEEVREILAPLRDLPAQDRDYRMMDHLCRFYTAMRRMAEVDVKCAEQCLAQLDSPELAQTQPDALRFPQAADTIEFQTAGAELDAALLGFHWMRNELGIDMIMRAVLNEKAGEPIDAEDEARRDEHAANLRFEMREDQALLREVHGLANELQEAQVLGEWAEVNVLRLASVPQDVARGVLRDPHWAKLNGKARWVVELGRRAQAQPVLAPHFKVAERTALPYRQ